MPARVIKDVAINQSMLIIGGSVQASEVWKNKVEEERQANEIGRAHV